MDSVLDSEIPRRRTPQRLRFTPKVEGYSRPSYVPVRTEGYSRESGFHLTSEIANLECEISGERTTLYDHMIKGVIDPALQQVLPAIVSNTCVIETGRRTLIGSFVEGRVVLIPLHFKDFLEESFTLKNMFTHGLGQEIKLADCDVIPLLHKGEATDACLLRLPLSVPSHKKITNKFVDANQQSHVVESEVSLVLVRLVGGVPTLIIDSQIPNKHERLSSSFRKDGETSTVPIRMAYSYTLNTQKGDCGCLLISRSTQIARKIVGMHVAGGDIGRSHIGVATAITNQMLVEGLSNVENRYRTSVPDLKTEMPETTASDDFSELTSLGDMIHHGHVKDAPRQAVDTDLRPSPLQHIIEPKCKPAFLRPVRVDVEGRKQDPMLKGLKKVANTQSDVPDNLLDRASRDVLETLEFHTNSGERRVLTREEAIVGVEDDPYINPLIRKTSPGYPWVNQQKAPGKHLAIKV